MWFYCILLLLGIVGIFIGITKVKRTKNRSWHYLTAAGAVIAVIGLFLMICVILLINRDDYPAMNGGISPDGNITNGALVPDEAGVDWRAWRSYSEDYIISDKLSICFSILDDSSNYGVYNSADGMRIGTVIFDDGEKADPAVEWIYKLEDHNGDGTNDLGIKLTDGTVIWFCYDENLRHSWPDPVYGCFPRQTE